MKQLTKCIGLKLNYSCNTASSLPKNKLNENRKTALLSGNN